ncbi:MAG: hypothetical protein O7A64_05580 [Alphaproteobacteria bacterium]|nr:hypothetical protein [Alphaproteobacteria bacterium]
MRTFAVLVPLILLNACALPAVYSIATLAVDGISYATSGKGLSDHALSAVANEDCAMWRVLVARPICSETDVPETTVATASEFGEFEVTAAVFAATPALDQFGVPETMVAAAPAPAESEVMEALAVAPASGAPMAPETETLTETLTETPAEMPAATASAAKRPTAMAAPKPEPLAAMTETPATTAAPADRGTAAKPVQLAALVAPLPKLEAKPKLGRFVVLASYLKEAHARAAMKRGREFQPRMARVRVRGKLYYRVLSGPYARDAIGTMRRTLIGAGFPDAWTGTFCQDTLRLVPCRSAPPPLNVSTN